MNRPLALLAGFVALAIATQALYAGPNALASIATIAFELPLLALWLAGAYGAGRLALRADIPTTTAIGLGIVGLVAFALALAGLLNQFTAFAILAPGALRTAYAVYQARDANPIAERHHTLLLALAPIAGMALWAASIPPGLLWGDEPNGYDVTSYHLQLPREWFEAGRLLAFDHNVFSHFPLAMETHYLLAMHLRGGPWAGMYLAQLMHLAMAGLCVAAVYSTTARVMTPRIATIAALFAGGVPWTGLLGPIAYNDAAVMLYAAVTFGWMCSRPALAGVAAGFAIGAKLTAGPMVLAAAALSIAPRPKSAATLLVVGLLTASPWLIRTAILNGGNPVFPQATSLLGPGHFTPEQVERWSAAHSPRPDQQSAAGRLGAGWSQIAAAPEWGYALIPLAILGAILHWRRHRDLVRPLTAIVAMQLLIWLTATHLQSRFFTPAIPPLAVLAALAMPRLPALTILFPVAGALHLALHGQRFRTPPLPGLTEPWQLLGNTLPTTQPLTLVGEANAFWFPQHPLTYTTVFDLRGPSAPSAWRVRPGDTIWLNPPDAARLHDTYRNVPELPAQWQSPPEPPVLRNSGFTTDEHR